MVAAEELRRTPLFGGILLTSAILGRARFVRAGGELASEGEPTEPVILVLDGWVASWKMMRDGRRQIIDIALPMDLLTPLSGSGETSWCGVEALTPGLVAPAPVEAFGAEDEAQERGGTALRNLAAAACARQAERMLRMGQANAYERVAYALLELYVRLEAIGRARNSRFRLPITQQRLGEYTGLSSVHVCRTLHRLADDGVLAQTGHTVVLRDFDRLLRITGINLARFRADIVPSGS
jgi:CRP-like cAMP-binding protein